MRRILGVQKLSILYIPEHYLSKHGYWFSTYHLPFGLDDEAAAALLIKAMDLQLEDLSFEDKQTADLIVEVCN